MASSGRLVPSETIVMPTTSGLTLNLAASADPSRTTISAPTTRAASPRINASTGFTPGPSRRPCSSHNRRGAPRACTDALVDAEERVGLRGGDERGFGQRQAPIQAATARVLESQ